MGHQKFSYSAWFILLLFSAVDVCAMQPKSLTGVCPEGTRLVGEMPPHGFEQSCMLAVENGDEVLHGKKLKWHDNGTLEYSTEFRRGLQHGVETKWDSDGHIISEGKFIDGKQEGIHRTWYTNGKLASELEFRAGLPEGRSRAWYEDGKKHFDGVHREGRRDGIWTTWSRDGMVRATDEYVAGQMIGRPVGTEEPLANEFMVFAAKQLINCPEGTEAVWSGMPDSCKALWCRKKTGERSFVRHGGWRCWHASGEKRCVGQYMNDKQDGTWEIFHGNGALSDSGSFADGVKVGRWTHWRDNGSKEFIEEYLNGVLNGDFFRYDENGRLLEQGRYKEGLRDGRWVFWIPQEKITKEVIYKAGVEKFERNVNAKKDGRLSEPGV